SRLPVHPSARTTCRLKLGSRSVSNSQLPVSHSPVFPSLPHRFEVKDGPVTRSSPILIVGSMAFDDLELPSQNANDVVCGSATYSSFAASTFTTARVVAVVGEDFPASVLEAMAARGIDTDGVERAKGKTFRWAGRYDEDLIHRTTLKTGLNVFASFAPKIPE